MTTTTPLTNLAAARAALLCLDRPCYVVRQQGQLAIALDTPPPQAEIVAYAPPISPEALGDASFKTDHGVRYAYAAGAMAGGIASEALVIALGQAKLLASFGAAGLVPARIEAAIAKIKAALPNGPYAFNLIHSPSEDALERRAVDLYLQHGIRTIEASAFLDLTAHVVRYRAAGLSRDASGQVQIGHKVIAKLSRREVAAKFMSPAPTRLLQELLNANQITPQQAELAQLVPMADDVTAEADSGGHTDNRPLVTLLPSIIAQRDETQAKHNFVMPVRVGAAGGIGTPGAVLAALMMGAAYVVTGSVNQASLEAGTSAHTKKLLAQADMADVIMAPAADMFEMGVKVQLLKRGTLFPMRAQKLYELYRTYDSVEAIPTDEREKLEKQVFRRPLADIWADTVSYFTERDPEQIARANEAPKRKMALIFRWYLGLSSRWSSTGEKGREMDYQVWCGAAMGAFNDWARGSYLEQPENRGAVAIAQQLMLGAAYLYRVNHLLAQGVALPPALRNYAPTAN
jgi:trans-AT polyketide synthase, acyltransferase and oxidoreductase domains